jgi:uroporphyrinogen-III synthase
MRTNRQARVLVTRPREQAATLIAQFTRAGMDPIAVPALDIVPLLKPGELEERLHVAPGFDWIVFISVNAVRYGLPALGSIAVPKRSRIAAVGAATARALIDAGVTVDAVPADGASSEALLRMPSLREMQGRHVLIVRGVGGRETLAQTLRARGALVEYAECYRRVPCSASAPLMEKMLAEPEALIATATSADILEALIELSGPKTDALSALPLAVMAPRIARAALQARWRGPVVTAKTASDEALVAAVKMLRPCV